MTSGQSPLSIDSTFQLFIELMLSKELKIRQGDVDQADSGHKLLTGKP